MHSVSGRKKERDRGREAKSAAASEIPARAPGVIVGTATSSSVAALGVATAPAILTTALAAATLAPRLLSTNAATLAARSAGESAAQSIPLATPTFLPAVARVLVRRAVSVFGGCASSPATVSVSTTESSSSSSAATADSTDSRIGVRIDLARRLMAGAAGSGASWGTGAADGRRVIVARRDETATAGRATCASGRLGRYAEARRQHSVTDRPLELALQGRVRLQCAPVWAARRPARPCA